MSESDRGEKKAGEKAGVKGNVINKNSSIPRIGILLLVERYEQG